MTDADWAAIPGLPWLEDEFVDDSTDWSQGVIDMTAPGEPVLNVPPEQSATPSFVVVYGGMVDSYSFDLNGDGQHEIYVGLSTPLTCSNGVVQCRFLVLDSAAPRRPLLETYGHCLTLGDQRHDGWSDLTMIRLRSDYVVEAETFQFDVQRYARATTIELGPLDMKD